MRSDKNINKEISAEKAKDSTVGSAENSLKKQTFGLKIFPDTMDIVNTLYEHDNCSSRSEFIEKAVRFYCGYLLNNESSATEFIAPQLSAITDGIVKGSEGTLPDIFRRCP